MSEPGGTPDVKALLLAAVMGDGAGLPASRSSDRPSTSDLSIDEVLLLHSVAWEPLDLVCGVSYTSIPQGVWRWGVGEVTYASSAHERAIASAVSRIEQECQRVGGHGVVGVHIELEIEFHHIKAVLVGTAVRPLGTAKRTRLPFVSDSARRSCTPRVALRPTQWPKNRRTSS